MKTKFEVPVVLFMFKRKESTLRVLGEIARVAPRKLYLIADGPRNETEEIEVRECREAVDAFVADLDTEVVRNYAGSNRGVYDNIAGGAKWVFEREARAIFLEDDTVPEGSFFPYCLDMLDKYAENDKVLWVCGTNYLGQYHPADGSDYVFTQHMLPCGWASWKDKFLKYYDGELTTFNADSLDRIKSLYASRRLYAYDSERFASEVGRKRAGKKYNSWDYQMAWSLRSHDKYGIAPSNNLILNIGDDADSTHGGTSRFNTMTRRFCGIPTHPMSLPLRHPVSVSLDPHFESLTTRIVLPPRSRVRRLGVLIFKRAFAVPANMPTREALHRLRRGLNLRHVGSKRFWE